MARSVVDSNSLESLKNSIETYAQNSSGSLSNFQSQANALLSQFEEKLSRLEKARDRAESALSSCQFRQRNSDYPVSCSSEEAAYERACKRYNQCVELVTQARSAIEDFVGKKESYNTTMSNLVSKATAGVMRVEEFLNDYSSNGKNNTDSGLGDSLTMPFNGIEEAPPSLILPIPGADQIAHVLPKGSGTNPIVIDPEGMAHKFDGLPPVQAPDPQTMRLAAAGILTFLAAGGLAVGSKEMLLQQKTDEIFEKQYGISRTELLIGSGPKQKEYIDAYNRIHQGLKQEMVEIKKEELTRNITNADNKIKVLSNLEDKKLHDIEALHDTKIHKSNMENQLATYNDGVKRRQESLGKTAVGGLSNDSLSYMFDGMGNSKRFITSCNLIAESGAKFQYDFGTHYQFAINEEHFVEVAHDGSWVKHVFVDNTTGGHVDFVPKAEFEISPTEFGYEYKPIEYKDEGFRFSYKSYRIAEDGSAVVWGYSSEIGLEANAGADINLSLHNIEGGISAGASVAKGGIKIGDLSAPRLANGRYVQTEFGIKGEAGLSAAIGVGKYKCDDGTSMLGVKAGPFSGGISLGKYTIPAKTFDETLRNQLR